ALRVEPRLPFGGEEGLSFLLEKLLARDVDRDAIEARRPTGLVAVDPSLGADPAPGAPRRDGAVLDVIKRPDIHRRVDRDTDALAVILVDDRIEPLEVDGLV